MRILATVILYNPDLHLLKENISAWIKDVEGVLIWDNSPASTALLNRNSLKEVFSSALIMGDGENHGIAWVLNYAWHYASDNGFDTLLTMDQDSLFGDFRGFRHRVESFWKEKGECLCGPSPNNLYLQPSHCDFRQEHYIITSGMLVPLTLLDKCQGYCSELAIDAVDVEICYHTRQLGYPCYRDCTTLLKQQYGQTHRHTILGHTFSCTSYSTERLYSIFRNHIIVWRHYQCPRYLAWIIIRYYFLPNVLKAIPFIEDQKAKRLKAIFKGLYDGGRYNISKQTTNKYK